MNKWEYLIVRFNHMDDSSGFYELYYEKLVNNLPSTSDQVSKAGLFQKLGELGWELVTASNPEYVFKRPKS